VRALQAGRPQPCIRVNGSQAASVYIMDEPWGGAIYRALNDVQRDVPDDARREPQRAADAAAGRVDAALVARTRAGDAAAFDELVRRHLGAAHAVALSVLGVREDAEDACQDAFVRALRHLDGCDPPEKFRPWLLAIVRNRALDLHRRARRRDTEALADGEGAEVPAPGATPLRLAERAELRTRLAGAIRRLTESQRQVLVLHEIEGWSHPEIGTVMGIDAGTSRAHLFAARRALRRLLSVELHPGE